MALREQLRNETEGRRLARDQHESKRRFLEAEVRVATDKYGSPGDWTPESLALHIEAVVQGGFVLAKAGGGAAAAAAGLDHLRRYLGLLFGRSVLQADSRESAVG